MEEPDLLSCGIRGVVELSAVRGARLVGGEVYV